MERRVKTKHKITLIAISILFAIVCLEVGLRVGGAIFLYQQEKQNQKGLTSSDTYKILCLGESTTALGGKSSYPLQLEKMLKDSYPQKDFKVINKGMPGITTSYIVSKLGDNLKKYKPDMVVVMMGINDDPDDMDEDDNWLDRYVYRFVLDLRVVKLSGLIGQSLKSKFRGQTKERLTKEQDYIVKKILLDVSEGRGSHFETGWGFLAKGENEKAEKLFRQVLVDFPNDVNSYINLGLSLAFSGKYEESEEILKKALTKEGDNPDGYIVLGQVYMMQLRYDDAIALLEDGLKRFPGNDDIVLSLAWSSLKAGRKNKAEELFRRNIRINETPESYLAMKLFYEFQNNPKMAEQYLRKSALLRGNPYGLVTQHNFGVLKDAVMRSGAHLVFVQYPRRNVGVLKNLMGEHSRIAYVDNEQIFNRSVLTQGYDAIFINNFAGDFGHCTKEGSSILAQNVADTIKKVLSDNSKN